MGMILIKKQKKLVSVSVAFVCVRFGVKKDEPTWL
jgi:hypothetical protein